MTELTDRELDELDQKVKEEKSKGTFVNFHRSHISVHNFAKVLDALLTAGGEYRTLDIDLKDFRQLYLSERKKN